MAPLVKEFQRYSEILDTKVHPTAQNREILDQVLTFFEIIPVYDLNFMKPNQKLFSLTSDIISFLVGHKEFKNLDISHERVDWDFCDITN